MMHAKLGPNGEVIPVNDYMEWARWFECTFHDQSRIIGRDNIAGFQVSTVFLGLDHNFLGDRPLWFETMVFRLDVDEQMRPDQEHGQWRYSTIEEARIGHAEICEKVRTGEIRE